MENLNFYKYVNDISILVITKKGKLNRLYCPFAVYDKYEYVKNTTKKLLIVDKIYADENNNIYYIIENEKYVYSKFIINL